MNVHGAKVGEKYYPNIRVEFMFPEEMYLLISTVLMTVCIASVANVKEIAVVTPPDRQGKIATQMLAALQILVLKRSVKIGGALVISALVYGTETVRSVDKIFGPGNAFVNEAKRQVFGAVGIDLLPGPSEAMVIADSTANPGFCGVCPSCTS